MFFKRLRNQVSFAIFNKHSSSITSNYNISIFIHSHIYNLRRSTLIVLFKYFRDAATVSIVDGRDQRYGRSTMGSEKYKLKWSKYESNILAVFSALLESETLSDVSLFCEGKLFINFANLDTFIYVPYLYLNKCH